MFACSSCFGIYDYDGLINTKTHNKTQFPTKTNKKNTTMATILQSIARSREKISWRVLLVENYWKKYFRGPTRVCRSRELKNKDFSHYFEGIIC